MTRRGGDSVAAHLPLLPELGEGPGDAALILRHGGRRCPDGDPGPGDRAPERDPPRGRRGAPPGPRGGERRRPGGGGGGLERERHGVVGWGRWVAACLPHVRARGVLDAVLGGVGDRCVCEVVAG
jgi:hypothetical protein